MFAKACPQIGTNKSPSARYSHVAPYKIPTVAAHTAKETFLSPLMCKAPKTVPATKTPTAPPPNAGIKAPRKSISSAKAGYAAQNKTSGNSKFVKTCLFESFVSFLKSSDADIKATLPAVTPTANADAKHACFQSTPSLIKPSVSGFISASFGTTNRAPNPSIKINVDVDVHDATTSSLLGITKDDELVEASFIVLAFSSRDSLRLFSTTSLYVSLFTFRFFGFCNLKLTLLLLLLLLLLLSIVVSSSFSSFSDDKFISLFSTVFKVVVVISLSIFLLSFLFAGFEEEEEEEEEDARTTLKTGTPRNANIIYIYIYSISMRVGWYCLSQRIECTRVLE
jgi:hypothetical protein